MFNNTLFLQLSRVGAAACVCLFLSGCPSASNPTQPQTPPQASPPSTPPPTSSSSRSAGSTSSNASDSSPSQPSQPSSTAQSETGSQPGDNQGTAASSDTMGPPDDAQTSGDSDDQAAQSGSEVNSNDGASMEPGFGDGIASDGNLPDLRDESRLPSAQRTTSESGDAAADASASENTGQPDGETAGSGSPNSYNGSGSYRLPAGMPAGNGRYDSPAGMPAGGSGPLTPAEQVAILDAQLEQGAGAFDTIIMETQAQQRAAARAQAAKRPPTTIASAGDGASGGAGQGNIAYEDGTADAGSYSTGGGMGGASAGGSMPQNTAKYPAPTDIPDGNNDDVVARQLREAAMREPDPAVRERLWDEYRKYTGLEK